jgi:hypothetical protein
MWQRQGVPPHCGKGGIDPASARRMTTLMGLYLNGKKSLNYLQTKMQFNELFPYHIENFFHITISTILKKLRKSAMPGGGKTILLYFGKRKFHADEEVKNRRGIVRFEKSLC